MMAGGTTTSARRRGGRAFGPLEYPRRAPRRRRGPLRKDRGPSISSPFGISTPRPAAGSRPVLRRNYWDDDYDWENYESVDDEPHVAFIKSTPNPKARKHDLDDAQGVGGIFMMLLEGVVVGVGACV